MKTMTYNGKIQYDPYTGALTWIKTGKKAGGVVNVGGRKYITVRVDGVSYRGHKLAWMIVTGKEPVADARIRFMDDDSLNIKAENLTYGTGRLSSYLTAKKYITQINCHGKYDVFCKQGDINHWHGSFDTEHEASLKVAELNKPPLNVRINITERKVIVISDEKTIYNVADKREAIAITQAILLNI